MLVFLKLCFVVTIKYAGKMKSKPIKVYANRMKIEVNSINCSDVILLWFLNMRIKLIDLVLLPQI